MMTSTRLELLSPAKNAQIGCDAILHGADAVYIGGPAFGARSHADNTVLDIENLAQFAHRYHARAFVTLNTILHDAELESARKLIWELYEAGADALIVQDMGLLEMDLPPIQLHASTQCDIRTLEKARFLGDVGFSQMVLARELSLPEIRTIANSTNATLEFFIHGALCVAFSGQCYISHAHTGRSANRGDCSQACRLPYTLNDNHGRVVAYDKHLLSMKDNDQSVNLQALIDAGIRSFKIEGRYKEAPYVKNITAHYRRLLDTILEERPELSRASSGHSTIFFTPDPQKTFHRGATDYFVNGRHDDIGAFESPKFIGVPLGNVTQVEKDWFDVQTDAPMSNGDGLNFMLKRNIAGFRANRVSQSVEADGNIWRIFPNEMPKGLQPRMVINRNLDHAWEQALTRKSAERRIDVWMQLTESEDGLCLTLTDEDGISASSSININLEPAQDADKTLSALRGNLGKMGNTFYTVNEITLALSQPWFVPASAINALRRQTVEKLENERLRHLPRLPRTTPVTPPPAYFEESLSYLANVYNSKARAFYEKHGVKVIAAAYEAHEETGEASLMITKHCLRYSFNLCPKQAKGVQGVQGQVRAEPMTLVNGSERLTLKFDCKPCEMHVIGPMKKHIQQMALLGSTLSNVPITFVKKAH